jgi:FixJ family two-component response regulator
MGYQSEKHSVVFVIDDDASVREALSSLFRSVGLQVEVFSSGSEFLRSRHAEHARCLVLDVRLPGLSGLDFQTELARANINMPIIFITGHGDIPQSVRAMKAGAVEFLTKPLREQDLLDAVQLALERDRSRREAERFKSKLLERFEALTPREQEVMAFVTTGLMNKQIAAEIGTTEITVKVHRSNVMKKTGARSLADLVRMADVLNIHRVKTDVTPKNTSIKAEPDPKRRKDPILGHLHDRLFDRSPLDSAAEILLRGFDVLSEQ